MSLLFGFTIFGAQTEAHAWPLHPGDYASALSCDPIFSCTTTLPAWLNCKPMPHVPTHVAPTKVASLHTQKTLAQAASDRHQATVLYLDSLHTCTNQDTTFTNASTCLGRKLIA